MTKSVAASVVCLLPLLAACPPDSSPCVRLSEDVLVEVTKDSAPDNEGSCKVPSAFRLSSLGCNIAVSPSADLCDVAYDLICLGDVRIEMKVKQLQPEGTVGTLSKVDLDKNGVEQCSLDLEVLVKQAPPPRQTEDDE